MSVTRDRKIQTACGYANNGFTLIELMVVLVVLSLLIMLVVPAFINLRDRAREASLRNNAHAIQLAAEDFCIKNEGIYASNLAQVTAIGGHSIVDLLPGGNRLENPFTQAADSPVDGVPGVGQVGYEMNPLAPAGSGYRISGADVNGNIIIVLSTGS